MNEHRGETSITLGGVDYTLRPTFEALAEMESRAGCGILKLTFKFFPDFQGGTLDYTLKDLSTVISCGIKGAGGTVPKDLGALIMDAGVTAMGRQIATFLLAALQGGQSSGNAPAATE